MPGTSFFCDFVEYGKARHAILMEHDLAFFPMEQEPSERFFSLVFPLLTPVESAREGDLVGIGIPMTTCPNGKIVFDCSYSIPEMMVRRNNGFTLGAEDDLSGETLADFMRAFAAVRRDSSFMTCARSSARRLVAAIPDDGAHKGIIAWQFNGFALSRCWSHDVAYTPVIHSDRAEAADYMRLIMDNVGWMIRERRFTRGYLHTLRRG